MDPGLIQYAPIFWFHEHESYFPVEVKAIVENAYLYKQGKKVPFGRKLENLVSLDRNGRDYWLEPSDIEFNLSYKKNYNIRSKKGYGLTYASEAIKEWYDGLKHKYKKVIYARHGRIDIQRNEASANVFSGAWSPYRDMLIGNYDVYQYFPFYIFNDFTNLHIGDWDSMVEVYVNNSANIAWIRTHAHEFAWLTKMERSNQYRSINNWLIMWNNHKNGVLNIFNVNKHPFIFVSKGGHGCYPTPGYSVRGIGPIKLPIAFEERDIGKSCYIPKAENNGDSLETDVRNVLDRASIKTDKFKSIEYEIIDFDSEAWSTYRGRWGNRSDLKTWDSPVSAPNKHEFAISKDNFIARFNAEYKKGYKSELIFYNYNGLLEIQS